MRFDKDEAICGENIQSILRDVEEFKNVAGRFVGAYR
jgi:hypothetical protein